MDNTDLVPGNVGQGDGLLVPGFEPDSRPPVQLSMLLPLSPFRYIWSSGIPYYVFKRTGERCHIAICQKQTAMSQAMARRQRLEQPYAGPGRDIQPPAVGQLSVELQGGVGLEEVVVAADLHGGQSWRCYALSCAAICAVPLEIRCCSYAAEQRCVMQRCHSTPSACWPQCRHGAPARAWGKRTSSSLRAAADGHCGGTYGSRAGGCERK